MTTRILSALLLLCGSAYAEDPLEDFVTPALDWSNRATHQELTAAWRWENPAHRFIRAGCRLENPYTFEPDGKPLFLNRAWIVRVPEVWHCPDGKITVLFVVAAPPDYTPGIPK